MVRIEKTEQNRPARWRLQGRLAGTNGEYFAQELAAFLRDHHGEALDLDLREVQFMHEPIKKTRRVEGCAP